MAAQAQGFHVSAPVEKGFTVSPRCLCIVNFDGLVGPSHHYGGLATGNLASRRHRHAVSSPRQAALEGLAKMKWLADQGIAQAVLPPQPRPAMHTLGSLGFIGPDAEVVAAAHHEARGWLHGFYSASAMWAANAATVSPTPDTADGRLHISPANLISQFHRSIEPPFTQHVLRAIFAHNRPRRLLPECLVCPQPEE